jgi:hypothetical protein
MHHHRNFHTYVNRITVELPHGRYLKAGEIIEPNDLLLYYDGAPRKASSFINKVGKKVRTYWIASDAVYRPE